MLLSELVCQIVRSIRYPILSGSFCVAFADVLICLIVRQ